MHRILHASLLFGLAACSDAALEQTSDELVTGNPPTTERFELDNLKAMQVDVTDPVTSERFTASLTAGALERLGRAVEAPRRVDEPQFEAGPRVFTVRYLRLGDAAPKEEIDSDAKATAELRDRACRALGRAPEPGAMPGGGVAVVTHEMIVLRLERGQLTGTVVPRDEPRKELTSFGCKAARGS